MIWILIFNLLIVNCGLLFLWNEKPKIIIKNQCDNICQEKINSRLNDLTNQLNKLLSPTPSPVPQIISSPSTKKKTRQVTYVSIPGSGSILAYDWTVLPSTEFYFDTSDFPGLIAVYFEANMKLFNGNGKAFLRLYDSTNGIGVQGSEVETSNQNNTIVVSGMVSFWRGRNLIKVQAKSLTADTTVFNSGRLKIITEN